MTVAVSRMHGVGFLHGGHDAAMRMSTYEEKAGLYEALGILPSDENISGRDYYWNKDDATLRSMAAKYRQVYAPVIAGKVRGANRDSLRGAIDSTEIGTLPLFLDQGFFDVTPKDVIVAEDTRRTPWRGKTVNWNVQTAAADAVFAATENPTIVDQDDTFVGQALTMSVIYGRLTLTGLGMAVADPFVNLMNYEVQRRVMAIKELIEQTILTGDGTSGAWAGMQSLFTTNSSDITGGAISLQDLDDILEDVWVDGGNPDRGIAPHNTVNAIGTLLRDNQRIQIGEQTTAIGGWQGLRNFVTYNGIPIFGSRFMPNTSAQRELYYYQQDVLDMPTLQDIVIEPLAKTGDAETWLIKTYLVFRDRSGTDGSGSGGVFHGRIDNIA